MSSTVLWAVTLLLALGLTAIELSIRYSDLRSSWICCRWSRRFVAANLLAVAGVLGALYLAGINVNWRVSQGTFLISLAISEAGGLAIVRSGTTARKLDASPTTEETRAALEAYKQGIGDTMEHLLSFLITKSDYDLQQMHADSLADCYSEIRATKQLTPGAIIDQLPDLVRADGGLSDAQQVRLDAIIVEVSQLNLSINQRSIVLMTRLIGLVKEGTVRRAYNLIEA